MKVLRGILIGLAVLVALFLVVALFLPAEYRVERSVEINQPVEVVFHTVVDFNNRVKWDPWLEIDSTATSVIEVAEGFVGSTWSWEGERLGSGNLTIEEVVENASIRSQLVFTDPQMVESWVSWQFEPTEGGTKATWANEGKSAYPLGRYFGLFLDGMMGPNFERGLKNLRKVCEEAE